jgi:hypothetical protein
VLCILNTVFFHFMIYNIDLGSLVHAFKKSGVTAISVSLRRAIWNWIEFFPTEFISMCQSQKKADGKTTHPGISLDNAFLNMLGFQEVPIVYSKP